MTVNFDRMRYRRLAEIKERLLKEWNNPRRDMSIVPSYYWGGVSYSFDVNPFTPKEKLNMDTPLFVQESKPGEKIWVGFKARSSSKTKPNTQYQPGANNAQ